MKEHLIMNLNKESMRKALDKLGHDNVGKKPIDELRPILRKFSYNQIVKALKP